MNIALAIMQMYPSANPVSDFEVHDDGPQPVAREGVDPRVKVQIRELAEGETEEVEGTHYFYKYNYDNLTEGVDYDLVDKGQYIAVWNLSDPVPTQEELEAAWAAYEEAEADKVNQKTEVEVLQEEIARLQTIITAKTYNADEVFQATDVESTSLDDLKTLKINQLDYLCTNTILAGFKSSALGAEHVYGFNEQDQANLSGRLTLINADTSYPDTFSWKTTDAGPLAHTKAQFIVVCRDADTHKNNYIAKYWSMKYQVQAVTTKEDVLAIVWS